ncbi:MAG: HD domain-containing protein [Isosphaeraceae bacterium]
MIDPHKPLFSDRMERALRLAAVWHNGQSRRGSGVPYIQHVVAVALVLDRLGYPEDVVIAGLLHDAVEDTDASLDQVRLEFGPLVADLVAHCSEIKTDAKGQARPWIDRKRDHIAALATAPSEAKAVVLADKLHNLISIAANLREGGPVWSLFHADRTRVLWYYRTVIDQLGTDEETRLGPLVQRCREVLAEVETLE